MLDTQLDHPRTCPPTRAVKAVIPAAGLATRFLPATKAVPKELLPVVDRPVLQYIVEEAAARRHRRRAAGHRPRQDRHGGPLRPRARPGARARGEGRHRAARPPCTRPASSPRSTPAGRASRSASATPSPYAESHVGDEPFAVLLGDEFIDESEPLLPAMLDLQARTGGIVLAFIEVAREEIDRYGIASVEPADRRPPMADEVVAGRPAWSRSPSPRRRRATSPSSAATCCRPRSSTRSARIGAGRGGEIQLTDAMALLLAEGTPVHGVVYRGTRYDTGMPLGYLQAVVQLACKRADLGPGVQRVAAQFVGDRNCAGDRRSERRGSPPRRRARSRASGRTRASRSPTIWPACCGASRPLPPLDLEITQAHGNVLAEDVVGPARCPRSTTPRSTATRPASTTSSDAQPGRPVRLNVVGDLVASSWRPVRLTRAPASRSRPARSCRSPPTWSSRQA